MKKSNLKGKKCTLGTESEFLSLTKQEIEVMFKKVPNL